MANVLQPKFTAGQLLGFVSAIYELSDTTPTPPVLLWRESRSDELQLIWGDYLSQRGQGLIGIPQESISSSLSSLQFLLTQFFDRIPHLTRHIYGLLGEFFEDPSRTARTQRICVAFPNQLAIGQDGQAAPDP